MRKVLKVVASVLVAAALLALSAGPAMAGSVRIEACWANSCTGGGSTEF